MFYKLVDKEVVLTETIEKDTRVHVAKDEFGDITVSTVFIGIAMNETSCNQEPIVFETMIFGGDYDGFQDRYSTWDDAVSGHNVAVELAKK